MLNPSGKRGRRLIVALTVPIMAGTTIATVSTSAYADPTPSGSAGSSWLVDELGEDNLIYNDQYDFTDYGLSIDVAFAAAAATVNARSAPDVSAALAPEIENYITGEAFGDTGSTYAGPTAKALVLAQRTGADPTNFGGVNLVTRLEGRVNEGPGAAGRIEDQSTYGDNANAIGQAFAVDGLTGAGSTRAEDVSSFLIEQQCAAGFFRQSFSPVDAADQSCDGATDPTPDVDTTAIAALALQSRPKDPEAVAAVAKAVAWLKSTQAGNGSFGGDSAGPNANSTGLAATALGSACKVAAADRAADWLRNLQVNAADAGNAMAAEQGAVAYNAEALSAGRTEGITTETRDQFRRATAQAVPGLLWDIAARPTVSFGRTPRFGRVGKSRTVRVRGVDRAEVLCFADASGFDPIVASGGLVKVKVSETKAGKARYAATTGPGVVTERINWLDRTRFDVRTKKRVRRGQRQFVAIRGLERREKVRVLVRGKLVAKGKANARGKYVTRFKVGGPTGRTRVKVIGQFFNRLGFEPFRVTR